MPLANTDIVWRKSALTSDSLPAQNGGRMSFAAVPSGVKNNLFPDVSKVEREIGAVKFRKAFIHVCPADDTPLLAARVFLDAFTPAGDFVTLHPGTATDTEADARQRAYGVARLAADAAVGATTLALAAEHPAAYAGLEPFRVGDKLRLGNESADEWAQIVAASYTADEIGLTLAAPLAQPHAAADTVVSSAIEAATLAAAVAAVRKTSVAGTVDAARFSAFAKSAVDDSWTLTFTSASAFAIAGLATGAAGSGTIYADCAPANAAAGGPFWRIAATAWGGTFAVGDTVSFDTVAAALPVWYRREVPVGTAAAADNACSVSIHGESA